MNASISPIVIVNAITRKSSRAACVGDHQQEFDLLSLADVVAQSNRFNSHQLVIVDPDLSRQFSGGPFRADNKDTFAQFLEKRFDVVAQRTGEKTILRGRHPATRK